MTALGEWLCTLCTTGSLCVNVNVLLIPLGLALKDIKYDYKAVNLIGAGGGDQVYCICLFRLLWSFIWLLLNLSYL